MRLNSDIVLKTFLFKCDSMFRNEVITSGNPCNLTGNQIPAKFNSTFSNNALPDRPIEVETHACGLEGCGQSIHFVGNQLG